MQIASSDQNSNEQYCRNYQIYNWLGSQIVCFIDRPTDGEITRTITEGGKEGKVKKISVKVLRPE